VPPGKYYFYINADNAYPPQYQQYFTLDVINLSLRFQSDQDTQSGYSQLSYVPGSAQPGSTISASIAPNTGNWNFQIAGTPEYVLRNDDPKDLYSQDMLYVSGAEYVKYDLLIDFVVDGERYQIREFDNSPCNDHHLTAMSDEERKAIEDYFKNRGLFIEYERVGFGPDLDARLDINLADDFLDWSVFDYGSVMSAVAGMKSGILEIGLGDDIGTLVPSSVFSALKERSAANVGLSFGQQGATMTFMSGSIESPPTGQRYDFAFSSQAISETAMKEAAGREAASFTFMFAHNSSLPGFARFDIVTDLAAGTTVQVYKYDAASQQFTAIAENITVAAGGVVSYQNNMMSEYIITTAKLKNTIGSEALEVNLSADSHTGAVRWPYYVGGGLLLMLLMAGILLLMKRRKQKPVETAT